jgi:hypothetical protein
MGQMRHKLIKWQKKGKKTYKKTFTNIKKELN